MQAKKSTLALSLTFTTMLVSNLFMQVIAQPDRSDGNNTGYSDGSAISSPGSSGGSPGMEDKESDFQQEVKNCAKMSTTSSDYAESLMELGMYYNRHARYMDAQRSLRKSLAVIDGGAIKPSTNPIQQPKPPDVVRHSNGTVSATTNVVPAPYESTLQNLLPALVTAETETNQFKPAEGHVKRLIEIAQSGRIPRVPTLMFAYNQYAALLIKQGRTTEAKEAAAKAAEINSHIIGL